jgi:hypothetical protein
MGSENLPNLRIDVFPDKEGTVTIKDKYYFQKTFSINVINKESKPINLSHGCFVLFNRNGEHISSSGIQLELLGEYEASASKNGLVYFIGDNKDFYGYPFVKWSKTDCENS